MSQTEYDFSQPSPALLSIGEVLVRLRGEFEEITISKIRFLETNGLVRPERTPSGYRKFSLIDVERLRYVLRMQRDHFLPLRVIKEHIDALNRGLQPVAIVDATPKLADLMQVKVRSYNLKSDPLHKQLGVIAQELETIFPGLIDESPDYEPQIKTREVEVPAVADLAAVGNQVWNGQRGALIAKAIKKPRNNQF